jgi:HD-GYP domain-containing protein (c-di-GMP phosphodiesterase class II)
VKHFIKHYSLLIFAQAACLALGLWLEQRFILALPSGDSSSKQNASASAKHPSGVDASEADPPRILSPTPKPRTPGMAIHIMTLIWIAACQTAVAYLVLMKDQEETTRKHRKAEKVSLRQYNELLRTRDAVIFGLAKLAESRHQETGNHLERISIYATCLASAVRRDPRYRSQVSMSFVKLIGISSVLHDIGKVGIRDSILLKPGELERQERTVMQLHATIGGKCVLDIESRLGKSSFLKMAREIAFNHHERWDGKGYPRGIVGEQIPLAARIVSIADVYDALSSKRVYRDAFPHDKCVQIIADEAGKLFDPGLVEIFLKLESEFFEIAERCRDESETAAPETLPELQRGQFSLEDELSAENNLAMVQSLLEKCAGDSLKSDVTPCPTSALLEESPVG